MVNDTPLHKAAHENDVMAVTEELDGGADINAKGAQGRTALHRALGAGGVDTVALLIERKADVNKCDQMQRNALHWAAGSDIKDNAKQVCEMLFDQGGINGDCVNAQSSSDSTPLHFAISKGYGDVCQLLMKHNADISLVDDAGKSCKQLAKDNGLKSIVK